MTTQYDAIIIGAGLNGLVTANYLAKAGKKVLVLERRDIAGGQAAPESFGDGFQVDPLHAGGSLRPDIVTDLDLEKYGLAAAATDAKPVYLSLLPDGKRLHLVADGSDARTLASIRELSAADAAQWPAFVAFMNQAASFLDAAYRTPMPRLPHVDAWSEGVPLAKLAWKLRRLGGRNMFRVIRSMSMSALELTEEWFESEALRAAVAAVGIHGFTLGSMSAGTGYTLMHNWLNRGGLAQRPVAGGTGRIVDALVSALQAQGGILRPSAEVQKVLADKQQVVGVRLANGEEIAARTVFSAADPRHTLLGLVGAVELPPEFVWHTRSIKMRGSVSKVHLRTDGSHGLPAGTLAIAPTLRYLERAFDAAKYGHISEQPYLEITSSDNIVSIHFQFSPYALRDGDWDGGRAHVEQLAVDTLARLFPALQASIRQVKSITPPDLEAIYGLTEGDLNHGQLILDQMFFMRPMPGWSNHRTPIDGLYLCGSGVHGGGGVSGASGRNAARVLLNAD
jgi:phytoene dehydrogenase-like protein